MSIPFFDMKRGIKTRLLPKKEVNCFIRPQVISMFEVIVMTLHEYSGRLNYEKVQYGGSNFVRCSQEDNTRYTLSYQLA